MAYHNNLFAPNPPFEVTTAEVYYDGQQVSAILDNIGNFYWIEPTNTHVEVGVEVMLSSLTEPNEWRSKIIAVANRERAADSDR